MLARHYGAIVTAFEPTRRFASLARTLTDRAGLADQVTVVEGDGRTLPFADAGFDLVWTQAVWQSVEDKPALSAEIHRVLRPGGRLALLEVIGDGEDLHYPVPWADGPAESFVVTGDSMASLLQDAGFLVESWRAGADAQTAIVAAVADTERMAPGLPGIGLDLVMPDYEARMAGLAGNIEAGRISLLLAVMTKDRERARRRRQAQSEDSSSSGSWREITSATSRGACRSRSPTPPSTGSATRGSANGPCPGWPGCVPARGPRPGAAVSAGGGLAHQPPA